MTVFDNTIEAEGLGSVFKNLGRTSAKAGKKIAIKVLKNQAKLRRLLQTLLPQLQLKTLKQIYHHYLKWLISITQVEGFTLANLYKLCYINGTKQKDHNLEHH